MYVTIRFLLTIQTENKFIEDYAGSVIDVNPVGVNDDGPGELLEQMTENNTLERVSSFLGFYREQLAKKDNNGTLLLFILTR